MEPQHRILRLILPAKAFAAIRAGTKAWLAQCPCGHKRNLWDLGGIRWKAAGEPRQIHACPACSHRTLHIVRLKAAAEKRELP